MNNCARCGLSLAAGAAFCPQCGTPVGARIDGRLRTLSVIAGVLILAALAIALQRAGVLHLFGGSGASVSKEGGALPSLALGGEGGSGVAKPGDGPPSVTVPGDPAPSVGRDRIGMPDDVRAWLDHLKRIDRERERLNEELGAEAMGIMGSLHPGVFAETEADAAAQDDSRRRGTAEGFIQRVNQTFAELTRRFQSLPPPDECRRIAAEYNDALLGTRELMGDLIRALEDLSIQRAAALEGKSLRRVDQPVQNANELIEALCRKYDEPNVWHLFVERGSGLASGMGAAAALEGYGKLLENVDKWANDDGGG
jgi:hypothetical protein